MQNRKSSAVLAILVTISLGIVSVADAWDGLGRLDLKALSARQQVRNAVDSVGSLCGIKQSPRSAIAARQDLQNEVCIAMSDKRISSTEYDRLMADGRRILPADEFADYERWVNQLAPEVFKAREAVLVAKKKAQQAAERRANREVATVLTINDPSPKLEIPTGVVGPDRVAASRRAW